MGFEKDVGPKLTDFLRPLIHIFTITRCHVTVNSPFIIMEVRSLISYFRKNGSPHDHSEIMTKSSDMVLYQMSEHLGLERYGLI